MGPVLPWRPEMAAASLVPSADTDTARQSSVGALVWVQVAPRVEA